MDEEDSEHRKVSITIAMVILDAYKDCDFGRALCNAVENRKMLLDKLKSIRHSQVQVSVCKCRSAALPVVADTIENLSRRSEQLKVPLIYRSFGGILVLTNLFEELSDEDLDS
ncbi:hypothetical protein VTL71DRAFT_12905, partial [Oculimacula yallundae]